MEATFSPKRQYSPTRSYDVITPENTILEEKYECKQQKTFYVAEYSSTDIRTNE
jgi:hypothetical protein